MITFECAVDGKDETVNLPDDVGSVLNLMQYRLVIGLNFNGPDECYIDVYPQDKRIVLDNAVLYMAPVYSRDRAIENLCQWVRDGCIPRDESEDRDG